MPVEFEVDHEKCIASGACAIAAPEVFGIDDDGMIVVLDAAPDEDLRVMVEDAAAACPASVIVVASRAE